MLQVDDILQVPSGNHLRVLSITPDNEVLTRHVEFRINLPPIRASVLESQTKNLSDTCWERTVTDLEVEILFNQVQEPLTRYYWDCAPEIKPGAIRIFERETGESRVIADGVANEFITLLNRILNEDCSRERFDNACALYFWLGQDMKREAAVA